MLHSLRRFLIAQREAIVVAAALAFLLQSLNVFALESRLVAGGFSQPLFVTAPTGDDRLFVVEKAGVIKVMQNGTVLDTPFLDISALVNDTGERGLLGLAFDPNFAVGGAAGARTFYVNYINNSGNTVVRSYQVSAMNPNQVDLASATTLITVPQPAGRTNHKAGWIGFRPGERDNLYIATGDGGSGNDPDNNGQNLDSNLGKILRINVRGDDFPADNSRNYAVPSDNPFKGDAPDAERNVIWAYGLRNPFRNSFDRVTGDFYIADVGQGQREEINLEAAGSPGGANYGWRLREGTIQTPTVGGPAPPGAVGPILDYPRNLSVDGQDVFLGRSVIGGYVYRAGEIVEIDGAYLFGDFVSSRIWAIRYAGSFIEIADATDLTELLNPVDPDTGSRIIGALSSFGEDGFGRLYLVDLDGQIFAVVPEPSTYAAVGLGIVLLGLAARRRRRG